MPFHRHLLGRRWLSQVSLMSDLNGYQALNHSVETSCQILEGCKENKTKQHMPTLS